MFKRSSHYVHNCSPQTGDDARRLEYDKERNFVLTRPSPAPLARRPLAILVAFAALLTAALLLAPTTALAGASGQLGKWDPAVGAGEEEVFNGRPMGVDSADGSIFTGSFNESLTEMVFQKFSKTGTFEGAVTLPGLSYVGIAVDPVNHRFYVLKDEGGAKEVTKILAFSTTPDASKELVPAPEKELPVPSGASTLFQPQELVIDPSTGNLIVLAKNEEELTVLQRIDVDPVTGEGAVSESFIDSGEAIRSARGIAVDGHGVVYVLSFEETGGEPELLAETLPANFSASSVLTPVSGFGSARLGGLVKIKKASTFNFGPQVAVTTSAIGGDTIFWKTETTNDEGESEYLVEGYSVKAEANSVVFGGGAEEEQCMISSLTTSLAAGEEGRLIAFDQGTSISTPGQTPAHFPIVYTFGPGGSGCPAPAPAFQMESGGHAVTTVPTGRPVTFNGAETETNGATIEQMVWEVEGPDGSSPRAAELPLEIVAGGREGGALHNGQVVGTGTIECAVNGGAAGPCLSRYPEGYTVKVIAEAATGDYFDQGSAASPLPNSGWTGQVGRDECDSVEPTSTDFEEPESSCTLTMSGPRRLELHFAPKDLGTAPVEVDLSLAPQGRASGGFECAVSGGPTSACKVTYPEGTTVTVTPKLADGAEFNGWSNACTGTGPCAVTMPVSNPNENSGGVEAPKVVAFFDREFTGRAITPATTLRHTFSEPGIYTIWMKLEADSPEFGTDFVAQPQTLEVTEGGPPTTEFPLNLSTSGTGSGSFKCKVNGGGEETCAAEYEAGKEVQVITSAATGSKFANWTGDCTGTGACLLTMSAAHSVVGVFNAESTPPSEFALTITPPSNGSILCSSGGAAAGSCAAKYAKGTVVTLSATPASGFEFANWTGDCSGTGACSVTMSAAHTVGASFKAVQSGGGGGGGGNTGGGGGNQTTTPPPGGGGTPPPGGGGTPPPGGGGGTPHKTPAQILAEKQKKAVAKCKKLSGKAEAKCLVKARQIGKPKKKKGKGKARSSARIVGQRTW
jgi:hypothetical protein